MRPVAHVTPTSRITARRSILIAEDMERPSSSRMAETSFFTSDSILMVVDGTFGGMAAPISRVHHGGNILAAMSLRGRVLLLRRPDVALVANAS